MHDPMSMAVSCSLQYLVSELLDSSWRQRPSDLPHILFEIKLAVFEDQVQIIILVNYFFKLYDIRVLDTFEQ